MFFPFTSASGFVLSQCPQPSFVLLHLFSWQVLMMGPMCLSLLCLVPFSNCGSPNGSGPDLDGMGHRSIDAQFKVLRYVCCYHSRVDSQILTTTSRPSVKPCVWLPPELPVLNRPSMPSLPRWRRLQHWNRASALLQNLSSLTARICKIETDATSLSSGSDSARSWNILGHSNSSTAAGSLGSHGPGSCDDSRNTRRRLEKFPSPEDEQARGAVLLRFPCEQYHKGTTKWINNLWEESNLPAFNKPVRIHCKAGSVVVGLVFETRAKCQDFIARYRDDGIPYTIDSPFCCTTTTIIVRQSKSIEDREIGKQFAPLWRELAEKLKVLFPEEDHDGAFIIPALDARSHVFSIKDRRNGVGKPVFKLASLGN